MISLEVFLKELSALVSAEIDKSGLVQEQFAKELNLTQGTISKLEAANYVSFPKFEVLIALADYKGIPLWQLLRILEQPSQQRIPDNPRLTKVALIGQINQNDDFDDLWEILLTVTRKLDQVKKAQASK